MSKEEELAEIMIGFIKEVVTGHENGFYKMFQKTPGMLTSDMIRQVIDFASVNYLNGAYKGLINGNDEYFQNHFNNMSNVMNHSHLCLIKIIFAYLTTIHSSMKRNAFDVSSHDKYMICVKVELDRIIGMVREKLVESVSHECSTKSIKECDPTVDLFTVQNPSGQK